MTCLWPLVLGAGSVVTSNKDAMPSMGREVLPTHSGMV